MTTEWLEIGVMISLGVGLIAFILALFVLVRARRQLQEANRLFERVTRELTLANSGSIGMGQRLLAMEKRLREAAADTAQGTSSGTSPDNRQSDYGDDEEFRPYAQAAQLFKLGLGSEEVARRCGLSRAEASLMEMMQKASR